MISFTYWKMGEGCRLVCAASMMLVLAGCALNQASIDQKFDTNGSDPIPGYSAEQLADELIALRGSQAKLARLSALENDLMLLFDELSKQSNLAERPTDYRPMQRTEKVLADSYLPATGTSGQQLDAESNPKHAAQQFIDDPAGSDDANRGSHYLLRLGYFVTEHAATAAYNDLSRKFDAGAMGLDLNLLKVPSEQAPRLALVIGPFDTYWGADAFCSVFTLHGQYCKVTESEGSV